MKAALVISTNFVFVTFIPWLNSLLLPTPLPRPLLTQFSLASSSHCHHFVLIFKNFFLLRDQALNCTVFICSISQRIKDSRTSIIRSNTRRPDNPKSWISEIFFEAANVNVCINSENLTF